MCVTAALGELTSTRPYPHSCSGHARATPFFFTWMPCPTNTFFFTWMPCPTNTFFFIWMPCPTNTFTATTSSAWGLGQLQTHLELVLNSPSPSKPSDVLCSHSPGAPVSTETLPSSITILTLASYAPTRLCTDHLQTQGFCDVPRGGTIGVRCLDDANLYNTRDPAAWLRSGQQASSWAGAQARLASDHKDGQGQASQQTVGQGLEQGWPAFIWTLTT